jgi:integrase/recombinase XerC
MRRAEGVCNRTINKELDYFSGFRKWCERECKIPAPISRTQRLPHKRPLPQILGIDEVIKILDASDPFYRAYFLALFSLGLRMDEARQLRWQDIDFKNRILRVKQKGGSFKILPASDWFTKALEEIMPEEPTKKELAEGKKTVAERFVFLNEKTGRPVFQVRKALARACEKAGITRHVYPHLFRHSVATFLMGKNINMRVIQGYMGHAKIGTTEFYTHVAVENLREAENAIMTAYKKVRNTKVKAR